MRKPSLSLLHDVANESLKPTIANAYTVLKFRAFMNVLGHDDHPIHQVKKQSDIKRFALTARGKEALRMSDDTFQPPFDFNDPPPAIAHWLSAFKRACRNIPEGMKLVFDDGKIHILVGDNELGFEDKPERRFASVKVPWHGN